MEGETVVEVHLDLDSKEDNGTTIGGNGDCDREEEEGGIGRTFEVINAPLLLPPLDRVQISSMSLSTAKTSIPMLLSLLPASLITL